MKIDKAPSTLFYPCPAVLVTSVNWEGRPNIITLAWAGVACSDPPTISLGIRPSRYSYGLIEQSREFVVNLPTLSILKETDYCGRVSGRDHDKFAETKLTAEPSTKVRAPLIKECPVNLECTLQQIVKLGSHDLFLGRVVAVHVEKTMLDANGRIDYSKAQPFVYNQEKYWKLGRKMEVA
jgi:flavin reductase (DIM6/NTAB) family NADH-FMN oxidoreductase RutF